MIIIISLKTDPILYLFSVSFMVHIHHEDNHAMGKDVLHHVINVMDLI